MDSNGDVADDMAMTWPMTWVADLAMTWQVMWMMTSASHPIYGWA